MHGCRARPTGPYMRPRTQPGWAGGLYSHLLDAAITLATDPASVVASTGAQLLRVAGVELIESELPPGEAPCT